MKFVLVPILMVLLLIQTFSKWVVIVDYELNRDYVAKNLCVNKAKLKMHCNGKCQMMKKMAEEEKENSSPLSTNHFKINIQETVYSDEILIPSIPSIQKETAAYNSGYTISEHSSPLSSVFHPPSIG